MNLENLIKNKITHLKPCRTIVTDEFGKRYEIVNKNKKELTHGLPFVVDEKPDLQIACILPGLFLSSQDPVFSREILSEYRIRHILSIGIDLTIKFDDIQYYHCELLDLPESDVSLPIKKSIEIIHEKRHENILVHCNAGVSRAPIIVISYLMFIQKLSYDEAYERVKIKRNCIRPNDGFALQLRMLNISDLLS